MMAVVYNPLKDAKGFYSRVINSSQLCSWLGGSLPGPSLLEELKQHRDLSRVTLEARDRNSSDSSFLALTSRQRHLITVLSLESESFKLLLIAGLR